MKYFVDFRLIYYEKRKEYQLQTLLHELRVLGNRGKFIKLILDGKLVVNNTPKSEIISQIEQNNFDKVDDSYDYLLRMPIYSLTKEVFDKLKSDFTSKKEEIEILKAKEPKELYLKDLNDLKKNFK